MQYTLTIFIILSVVLAVNALYIRWQLNKKKVCEYIAISGDYKGQSHKVNDWRKIAIDLAKCTKNSRINAIAKYGTDEDVIGLLYINFGIELIDNENS